ncbi:ArsR/SmtB family transcription factor [Actinocatenispora rupis]|uniref:Transcriptional regulator n=1 Tax=Actinocatenispora rupis TaxID=519421 RepID=A0A8J3N7Y0_9ACTN|nr:DUF5937 family protein [Actinocatenispora rupis]GID09739.1 transcriptional regulator [Actinocatenispora rupis]
MVVTLDLAKARPADLVAGASPLAELMAGLHVLAEPEHHPESRAWLGRVRERMPDGLATDLAYHAPLWARFRCRLFYPFAGPLDRDLDGELDALSRLDEDTFVRYAAIAIRGTTFPVDGLLADPSGFLRACERRSYSRAELARALVTDPAAVRAGLVETLARCATSYFDAEWRMVGPRLRDVSARLRDATRGATVAATLASMSPTATTTDVPPRVHYDKLQSATGAVAAHGCLLVPTLRGWPHLIVKLDPDEPVVVHFLAGDWEQHRQVSQSLVRERIAALAEPARLDLCRHLLGEPITTSELAERTALGEPQVSRHIRRLREVGLVTSRREGRMVYHRLHARLLLDLGVDLLATVMR